MGGLILPAPGMRSSQKPGIKNNVRIQEHRILTSAMKKQTSVCCSNSLNPYMVFQTSNLESREKKVKRKAILLLADISYC